MGHLKAHNISLVLDQPFVGQGMSDNPMNAIFVPSPIPVEVSLIQVVGITNSGSYVEAASGGNFGPQGDYGMFSPKVLPYDASFICYHVIFFIFFKARDFTHMSLLGFQAHEYYIIFFIFKFFLKEFICFENSKNKILNYCRFWYEDF